MRFVRLLGTLALVANMTACKQQGTASSNAAFAVTRCDTEASREVLDSGDDIADVDTSNGVTTWRIDQRSWPPIMGNPQAFVRKVADADACLHQPPLHIILRDPDGKFLGETGPAGTHIN